MWVEPEFVNRIECLKNILHLTHDQGYVSALDRTRPLRKSAGVVEEVGDLGYG